MRVALLTLTRDRLIYTQACFKALWEHAGYPFDHFVIDNGSKDGTAVWLQDHAPRFARLICNPDNAGISAAANHALDLIAAAGAYDLVLTFDNDCLVTTELLLARLVEIYACLGGAYAKWILAPRVTGIINQPARANHVQLAGHRVGRTAIVGGLCQVLPGNFVPGWRYPTNIPRAKGHDSSLCAYAKSIGYEVGYVEDLTVEHYETTAGQQARFPAYFARKLLEEQS